MLCKLCGLEKCEEDFYVSDKKRCKECVKKRVRAYRVLNLEKIREYDRARGSLSHRVSARKRYQETSAFAESHQKSTKLWAEKFPGRRKAANILNNAIRDGKILRQLCFVCGEKAEAHHPDYSRPLDVVWLCDKHHKETHKLARDLYRNSAKHSE